MKVLGLNWADSAGSRFNGVAIREELLQLGVEYSLAVGLKKEMDESWVYSATKTQPWAQKLIRFYQVIEKLTGFQSRFFFLTSRISRLPAFKEADLIHVHIVHNGWFRLRSLKKMVKKKPILWTIHDPWVLTGHCVFPLGCSRFSSGCGSCPDLKSPLPVYRDRTEKEVSYKKSLIRNLDVNFHFSTTWFKELFDLNMKVSEEKKHVIPFGININTFAPNSQQRVQLRESLGIGSEEFVVLVRATSNPQKGTRFFLEALKNLQEKIIIFTVDENNILDELITKHSIIEFGWVADQDKMIEILNATDLLIMPSLDETFGVMALEAMSCGTPVLYYMGTAIHELVAGNENYAMKKFNLSKQIELHLKIFLKERNILELESKRVRQLAKDKYSSTRYASQLTHLYQSLLRDR